MKTKDPQSFGTRPIPRSRAEKARILAQLQAELDRLKPTTALAIRQSITARIADLERELKSDPPEAPRTQAGGPAAKRRPPRGSSYRFAQAEDALEAAMRKVDPDA